MWSNKKVETSFLEYDSTKYLVKILFQSKNMNEVLVKW